MRRDALSLPEPLNLLSTDEQGILSGYFEPLSWPAGGYIFRAGEVGDGCYIIDSGDVRLELPRPKLDSDGLDTEPVLAYLRAGALLGELSLLDRLPRSAVAFAEMPVTARRRSAAIEELSEQHPRIGVAVPRALGARPLAGAASSTPTRSQRPVHPAGGMAGSDGHEHGR